MDVPMVTMERITVLKSLEIFRRIPDRDLEKVASILQEKEIPGGTDIIREGELGSSMFFIVEGRVRVHVQDKEVGILGSGSVFGELAALDLEPRSASVTTINDTFVLELDGDALQQMMSDRPGVFKEVLHILCQRIRSTLPKTKKEN
jgi:CRP/FNR family transcriptional regulator, cyclic AMP receptor protein